MNASLGVPTILDPVTGEPLDLSGVDLSRLPVELPQLPGGQADENNDEQLPGAQLPQASSSVPVPFPSLSDVPVQDSRATASL
jgi:hypothetical protein